MVRESRNKGITIHSSRARLKGIIFCGLDLSLLNTMNCMESSFSHLGRIELSRLDGHGDLESKHVHQRFYQVMHEQGLVEAFK